MTEKRDAPPAPPAAAPGPAPSGPGAPIGDMREEFQKLSRQQPRNPAAERAFIESKIELARGDPRLSEAEKAAIIAELQRLLERS